MKRFLTKVFKSDNCTLTIYKSKPKKKVFLLNSKHRSKSIDVKVEKNDKSLEIISYYNQPEIISYYNQTKFIVDMIDQMAKKYSTKSKSRRWPISIF